MNDMLTYLQHYARVGGATSFFEYDVTIKLFSGLFEVYKLLLKLFKIFFVFYTLLPPFNPCNKRLLAIIAHHYAGK